jgi:zinc protease
MSKKATAKKGNKKNIPGYTFIKSVSGIDEYVLKSNGLRVLYHHRPDTGTVTTNITYLVGAVDETLGESGIAHMLEHMLFKPTQADKKAKITAGGAMQFEREIGCILNANTWKDRTTYYFSYPTEYLDRALEIEAQRMTGVILNQKELTPEQNNVLSEFDMYNGDPYFALSVQMVSTAFLSHPYGHETIGYREDIEDYTPERLERFYTNYYRPDNAVMMVIGDVDHKTALESVKRQFTGIANPATPIPRHHVREPKQEGIRRVSITRPSTTNLLSIGFKHAGLGTIEWLTTSVMLNVLTSGPESVFQKLLVDTGKVASIDSMQEPTRDTNLAVIHFSLAENQTHSDIETQVLETISKLTSKDISNLIKKVKANMLTDELFSRTSSMQIAQELTEYTASGNWENYTKTPDLLAEITPKMVLKCLQESFAPANVTIGTFIGK